MKHILVTRASFDDDSLFYKYFSVIKDLYIPCLAAQSCKHFDVCIIIKNKHKELLENEFKKKEINPIFLIGTDAVYNEWVLNKNYNIQTRHDCDDWMAPNYIEVIQNEYLKNIGKFDSFLIQAQAVKMHYQTKIEYYTYQFPLTEPSMFLSLCQRQCDKSILQENHRFFSKIVPTVIDIGNGFVKWVVHENNIYARIDPKDVRI